MPARERYFCSLESQKNGEDIFATVARIRSWFLLEYPGAWRRNAIEDNRLLSPAVRDHMRRWERTILIRQQYRRDPGEVRAFVVDSSPESPSMSGYRITDYEQVRQIIGSGEPVPGLMFAVCTHGRHDLCCAKFGHPVWCALRELAPDRAWQCSHIGGDRFAANVMVLPHGIFYGRVRPEDLPELLRASGAGQIWMPGYRGRSCYGRAIQTAEYFLRKESGCFGFNDFTPLTGPHTTGDRTTVVFEARADGSRRRVEYSTMKSGWQQRLTCSAPEESRVAQHRLVSYTVE